MPGLANYSLWFKTLVNLKHTGLLLIRENKLRTFLDCCNYIAYTYFRKFCENCFKAGISSNACSPFEYPPANLSFFLLALRFMYDNNW